MHVTLAEALEPAFARIAVGHLRKVAVHAAVPAAVPFRIEGARLLIAHVEAVARGTHVGAGAAAEARRRQLFPHRAVERRQFLRRQAFVEVQAVERQLRPPFLQRRCLLCHGGGFLPRVRERHAAAEGVRQGLALFRAGVPVEAAVRRPRVHIGTGMGRVDAEGAAEAGLFRLAAAQADDGQAVAAGLVVFVLRILQEHFIEDLEAPDIAGPHAEGDDLVLRQGGCLQIEPASFLVELQ